MQSAEIISRMEMTSPHPIPPPSLCIGTTSLTPALRGDENFVPLNASHGSAKIPALQQIEFLAEFPKPFRRGGFKADENAFAPGLHNFLCRVRHRIAGDDGDA